MFYIRSFLWVVICVFVQQCCAQTEFGELLQTVQNLQADVRTLRENNVDLDRLRSENEQMKGQIQQMDRRLEEQEVEIHHLRESALSVPILKDRRQTPERVAFSTYLASTQEHVGIGQKIKFDAVLLNEGNGYNPHLGAFSAPIAGLYMFSYTIAKTKTGKALVHLMHNGAAVNSAVVDVKNTYQYVQSGNVALVKLAVGDVVYVEEYYQADADIADYGNRWTTFSGALLY